MELLIILVIFFLVIYPLEKFRLKMYAKQVKELENSAQPEKRCPPHKWAYDHTGRMFCDWCRNPPGYYKSSNGEYGR